MLLAKSYLLLILLFLSCASPKLQSERKSSIDANFQIKKSLKNSPSPTVNRVYGGIISKTLGSHCKWHPSDSTYVRLKHKDCGSGAAFLSGMGRFLSESGANDRGYSIVVDKGHLHFWDYSDGCF